MKSKITKISLFSGLILILVLWSVCYGNRGLKCISAAEAESIYGGGFQCVHNSTCDDNKCERHDTEPECTGNGHYQIASSAEYCTTGGTACDCTYETGKCYKKKTCSWSDVGFGTCMGINPSSTQYATVECEEID